MKRIILMITLVSSIWFTACGSGDKEAAKELLQRILNLVGIPSSMVVNICQDNNNNNFCEDKEVLAKASINSTDSIDSIFQKIFDDGSNRYWINNLDPDKKLLLVMQDTDRVLYDNGKFTLPFTINPSREQNASKELSILEAMVDEKYLNSKEVIAVKTMDSVEKFYDVLLQDLIKNFNTLKGKNLDSSISILANLKYMADELRVKGIAKELPDSVNACNGDITCVDAIINNVFKDLEISNAEAETIANQSNTQVPITVDRVEKSNRTIFLSKQTMHGVNNELIFSSTYQYDNENRVISSTGTDESCTFIYDNRDRLKESTCTSSKTIYEYNGDRLAGQKYYENSTLTSQWRVTQWNGNKPTGVEWTNNDNGTFTWYLTYTGNNPTHIEYDYGDGIKGTIDKEYDTKETPFDIYGIFGGNYYWWLGQNNVVKETYTSIYTFNNQTQTTKSIIRNELSYNRDGLPTKIDSYISTEGTGIVQHTYETYEYK